MEEKFIPNIGKFSFKSFLRALENEYKGPLPERVKVALREAFNGHRGQIRDSRFPENRMPFIVHPAGTALLAIKYFPLAQNIPDDLDTVVCVALLHDLLEDTHIDGSHLEKVVGSKVRAYVESLSKPPAEVAGKTSEERRREFLERILKAGPTVVFVKLCDNMHNLSSPTRTPPDLLIKLVEKTRGQYLPLLERFNFGEKFKQDYRDLVAAAEEKITKDKQFVHQTPPPATLEAAIKECVTVSRGKVLELHDISDILSSLLQAKKIIIWHYSGETDGMLTPTIAFQKQESFPRLRAVDFCELPQILTGTAVRKFPIISPDENCSTVFTVPMRTDPFTIFVVALGFGPEGNPPWLSLDAATMLVQFLAHRLVMAEASRRASLAGAAASLGIQLDIELASRLNVQPTELGKLQHWRNRCQQAISVVRHLINFFLLSEDPNIPLSSLVKVESRIKTVNSILRKYLSPQKRVWPEYENLEDIAGIRVICPTRSGLRAIEQFLLGEKARNAGVRLHSTIDEPRRDYINTPTKNGYRATHLILEVETRMGDNRVKKVPCEVQLRTMFQHVWAAISHAILYRAPKRIQRHHGEKLKEIEKALERCEELSEKLATKET